LVFILVFLSAGFIFLVHYWVVGNAIWGDGQYYYAYVHSLVIDGDLNFQNEMAHFGLPVVTTQTGLVANKFAVGPALFWLPFFLLAHLFFRGDGYGPAYQILTGLGSVFYGILGLFFCFWTVKRFFSGKIALVASIGLWLNSHSISFFLSSLIIYILVKKKDYVWRTGFLIGLLAATRPQDIIFALPWLFLLRKDFKKNITFIAKQQTLFIFFLFIGFLPQLAAWQVLYGRLTSPYFLSGETFFWLRPQVFSVLFSQNNGLFYYSPALILSLIGLLLMLKENRFMAASGLFLFLLQVYIVSSWHIWWGGAAYGGRMFISLLPVFVMGLAAFIDKVKWRLVCFPLLLLVFLNFWNMVKFLLINS